MDIKTTDLINKLIVNAINHGGDRGGPYFSCQEEVEDSISSIIEHLHLSDKCTVGNVQSDTYGGKYPQIVQRK